MRSRTTDPSNLALDPNDVTLKPGETITVDADLAIHEIDECSQDFEFCFSFVHVHGSSATTTHGVAP
jgi:hypothetical protein